MTDTVVTAPSLAERLGLSADCAVLATALTHSSYANEHQCPSNEQLELLGDAVVDLAVTELLLARYPDLTEGKASLIRQRLVGEPALAKAALVFDLGAHVRLGKSERMAQGAARPSLLADAFEAVIAAVFLERGYEAAAAVVVDALAPLVDAAALDPEWSDAKGLLANWAHTQGFAPPVYDVQGSGPSHAPEFTVTVLVDGAVRGSATGRTKKAAELAAARVAWEGRDDG